KIESPSDDETSWLTLDNATTISGTVGAGGNVLVSVGLDPSGLADALYTAYINIVSDDPDEGSLSVQVDMTVSTSGISVSPLTFDFGYVAVGEQSSDQFTIENTGNATLTGSISDLTGFTVSEFVPEGSAVEQKKEILENPTDAVSFSISGLSSVTYDLTFTPPSIGDYSGTITITHNAAPAAIDLTITAYGDEPDIDVSPTSMAETLESDETASQNLTISNTAQVNLSYNAEVEYTTTISYTIDVYPQSFSRWTGTTDGTTINQSSLVDCTYPQDGWMMFDLSSLPTDATIQSVAFNGYVNATNYPYWSITPISSDPLTADPATLHADIIAEATSGNYLQQNEQSNYAPGWKQHTLGGTVVEDLQAAIAAEKFPLGIVGRDGSSTYYIIFDGWNETNPPYLTVEYLLSEDSWLTLDSGNSVNGNIGSVGSDVITVGYNSAGLIDDNYNANINITSNDPDESEVVVPVTLTVATPGIAVSPASIDFGDILVDQSSTLQFSIQNSGTASLTGDITTPDGFTVAEETDARNKSNRKSDIRNNSRNKIDYTIPAGQTIYYDLTFEPVAAVVYSDDVTISHNAGGADETIAVTGTGITIQLGLNPTSFNESAYEGNTVNTSLTISNTGTNSLNYSGNVVYNTDALTTVSVYPQSADRWTGATDGTTITQTSLVDCTFPQDGWMSFDISSLPADAIIQTVTFNGYVSDTNFPYWRITPITSDPLIADPVTLHTDIVAEATSGYYLLQNESSEYTTGWKQHLLGGTVVNDVQSSLVSSRFSLGIVGQDASATYFIIFDGWNETNVPYLDIEYIVPGDQWMNLDGSQSINGTVSPNGSDVLAVQMDTNGLSPDTYTATISGTSNDPDNPTFSIPVSFTVLQVLDAP
ncbi:MAG: hypothetical protein DRI23_12110, partial [Candidatus Cloacimonadota bacterium]